MGLSQNEAERVVNSFAGYKGELVEKAKLAKENALGIFLEPLTDEQRELVSKKWPNFVARDSQTEWMFVGLNEQVVDWYRKNKEHEGAIFLKRPVFQASTSGKLLLDDNGKDFYKNELDYFLAVRENDKSGLSQILELDESKEIEIEDLMERHIAEIRQINGELVFQTQISRKEFESLQEKVNAKLADLRDRTLVDLKKVLGDKRWQVFTDVANEFAFRALGPLFDILEGPLSKELNLTANQRDLIQNSARAAIDEVVKSINEIERWVVQQIVSSMPKNAGERFLSLMGDPIQDAPMCVMMFLTLNQ
jgi:DNA-directed RNA polymerase subunit F